MNAWSIMEDQRTSKLPSRGSGERMAVFRRKWTLHYIYSQWMFAWWGLQNLLHLGMRWVGLTCV